MMNFHYSAELDGYELAQRLKREDRELYDLFNGLLEASRREGTGITKIEIAIKMLERGELSLDEISYYTDLSKDEIENIENKMKSLA